MSPSYKGTVSAVIKQEYERLSAEVKKFEDKGLFDTAHHTMLQRLIKQYPQLKSSITQLEEEEDGK